MRAENRAIQFFSEMVGPNLSGPTEPYFWTHLVLQSSTCEPAVRHSLIAISSLYEDISKARTNGTSSKVNQLHLNSLALTHYNAAIKELIIIKDQGLVLLICVLFICIELLQLDRDAALRHYRHGNSILDLFDPQDTSWVCEWLRPQFHRLQTLHHFFGDRFESFGQHDTLRKTPIFFSTLKYAEETMDKIFNHSFQLVRRGVNYRAGGQQLEQPGPDLLEEQRSLRHLLNVWYTVFNNLEARSTCRPMSITAVQRAYLLSKYRLCRIWTAMVFSPSEMDYDKYEDEYRRMVEDLGQAADERTRGRSRNNFEFEMGFLVPIFFMTIKCRYLDLRVRALHYLKVLAAPREALWEKDGMYALARRIIEIEHGLLLDTDGKPLATLGATCWGLPPNEKRVVHVVTGWTGERSNDFCGHHVQGRNVVFVFKSPDDGVFFQPDVLGEEPVLLPAWSPETTKREVLARGARI
ncbi:hypothetical protein GCG54_00005188 [Colletotrichum gloeosporioides]|uniref:C6 zinc finger protein n=1 Tax=Colletotrichum gloeosporioides TaxID=474922 RepID=A0A8H4CL78_COLGL|nr:uncharacterized protein GCG54_00005188 [Colletotrichum gloeosporioides]KAF3805822.1 hypothetical protein GCG54_00005188 [Colletotrichum gloeosporioides]